MRHRGSAFASFAGLRLLPSDAGVDGVRRREAWPGAAVRPIACVASTHPLNAQREAAAAATATLTMAASQTTKRKVKDKTPVMEGQTEEERRILRQEQRTLYDRIGDRNVDLQDLDHDAFDEERNNNNLFNYV